MHGKKTMHTHEIKEQKKAWRTPAVESLGIKYTMLSGSGTENADANDFSGKGIGG